MMYPQDVDKDLFECLNKLTDTGDVAFRGTNLFYILRNDLGQKIARAMRYRENPEAFDAAYEFSPEYTESRLRVWRELKVDVKSLVSGASRVRLDSSNGKKRVYFHQSTKLVRLASTLGGRDGVFALSNKRNFARNVQWINVPSTVDVLRSRKEAKRYTVAIERVLENQRIALLDQDRARLPGDVLNGLFLINKAFHLFDRYRPDIVVVGGDNFLPEVAFVLVARQLQIPTICIQHGLDCERFFHEQIHSDYFCAWGTARAERCRKYSLHQPKEIFLTGCPEFDGIVPERLPLGRFDQWLWLTRPHEPVKCCEPSRFPDEGAKIFQALLEAMSVCEAQRLVVKAHPRDDIRPYRLLAAQAGLSERVTFVEGRGGVNEPIREAGIVFAEDSTAGMEAMFFGKPLIHTHFSAASPALPFVDYGAALPGFTPGDIVRSINLLLVGDSDLEISLQAGQEKFLRDYAGPLDGRSLDRVMEIMEKVI